MGKLQRALRNIKDGVPKALAPAINRALAKGQTEVKREIRGEYTIKAKDIPVDLHRASRAQLNGQLAIRDTMLDLNKFFYRPMLSTRRTKDLFTRVRKGAGGSVKHGFANVVGSYSGPFVRIRTGRLPIKKLITIGAPIMASQPSVGPKVGKAMGETLDKRIDHEIERVISTAGSH
jgi:hypothetical protein